MRSDSDPGCFRGSGPGKPDPQSYSTKSNCSCKKRTKRNLFSAKVVKNNVKKSRHFKNGFVETPVTFEIWLLKRARFIGKERGSFLSL